MSACCGDKAWPPLGGGMISLEYVAAPDSITSDPYLRLSLVVSAEEAADSDVATCRMAAGEEWRERLEPGRLRSCLEPGRLACRLGWRLP